MLLGPEMAARLKSRFVTHPAQGQRGDKHSNIVATVHGRIEDLNMVQTYQDQLKLMDLEMKKKFGDLLPDDIPPGHHLPDTTYHQFILKDTHRIIWKHEYSCSHKWQDAWRTLLEGHITAGRIRPSSSEYSSPALLVPKADPTALTQWVNDYRELNDNTVTDKFPLPRIADILTDCSHAKIWG